MAMVRWKIYLIVFVPIIGISLIFRYLINTNKIKSNKVSRFFYYDDESFIESWKRTEEKGFLRYTLKNISITTFVMGVLGIFFLLNERSMYGYEQNKTLQVSLTMGVVLGLINSVIGWIHSEVRDRQLKEKGIAGSDNANDDN
jgi:hypothetical protein